MSRLTFVPVLVAAIAVAGCGGVEEDGPLAQDRRRADPARVEWRAPPRPVKAAETVIGGGSVEQRRLLREILERFGGTGIASLRIGEPRENWGASRNGSRALHATFKDESDAEAEWEGWLLAGAFEEGSRAAGLSRVVAYESKSGSVRLGGWRPSPAPRPASHPVPPDAAAIRTAFTSAAASSGARVAGFRIFRADERPAAAVVLQVDRPAEYLVRELRIVLAYLPELAGRQVEVRDSHGSRVYLNGSFGVASVVGRSTWIRSGLEGCDPYPHSWPAPGPPPCPFTGAEVRVAVDVRPQLSPTEVEAIAIRHAGDGERILSMTVGELPKICRGRGQGCARSAPGKDVAWLVEHSASPDPYVEGEVRWLVIRDGNGEAIAQGTDSE